MIGSEFAINAKPNSECFHFIGPLIVAPQCSDFCLKLQFCYKPMLRSKLSSKLLQVGHMHHKATAIQ